MLVALLLAVQVADATNTNNTSETRPFVGFLTSRDMDSLTPNERRAFKAKWKCDISRRKTGLMIESLFDGCPADRAGIKTGTIIDTINGKKVGSGGVPVDEVLRTLTAGQEVSFVGFSPHRRGRKIILKRATFKVTPVSMSQYIASRFVQSRDKVGGLTTFRHKNTPARGSVSDVSMQTVESDDGHVRIELRTVLRTKDWLFMRKITFAAGGERFEIQPPLNGVTRDVVRANHLVEFYDHPITLLQIRQIHKLLREDDDITIRLSGTKFYRDRTLTPPEKLRLILAIKFAESKLKSAVPKS